LFCPLIRFMGPAGVLSILQGDEGSSVREADVRALPGHPEARPRPRDLLEPAAQAEAGLIA
jgi:hypothetical protein